MTPKPDYVWLRVKIKERSGSRVLVSDGEVEVWLPKSMVYEVPRKPFDDGLISMPKWMAKDKGLKGLI